MSFHSTIVNQFGAEMEQIMPVQYRDGSLNHQTKLLAIRLGDQKTIAESLFMSTTEGIKTNASKHSALSYGHIKQLEQQLKEEVIQPLWDEPRWRGGPRLS